MSPKVEDEKSPNFSGKISEKRRVSISFGFPSRLLSFPINVKLDLNSTVSQIFSLKLGYEVRKIREDNNVLESKFK